MRQIFGAREGFRGATLGTQEKAEKERRKPEGRKPRARVPFRGIHLSRVPSPQAFGTSWKLGAISRVSDIGEKKLSRSEMQRVHPTSASTCAAAAEAIRSREMETKGNGGDDPRAMTAISCTRLHVIGVSARKT